MVRGMRGTAGLVLASGVVAGMVLSGCASGAAGPVAAGGSVPPSSPSASPSGAPSASASASVDAGPRPCVGLAVVQLAGDDGAAGTIVVRVQVTNGGAGACTISGYPDFTLTVGAGPVRSVTLVHGQLGGPFAAPATTLTLTPGGHAGFFVAYSNRTASGDGSCDTADRLHLAQPGSAPAVGPVQIPLCQDTLRVSAYVPSDQLTF
jgi:Protein of unknown function (DUF4232)